MTRKEYLLTCLSEECSETIQRITKALRFGLDEEQPSHPDNAARIKDEWLDAMAVYQICVNEGILPDFLISEIDAATERKLAKIEDNMAISRREGTLTE